MTAKGWGAAVVAWSVIAVLFMGTTVWAGALGLVRLGLAGDEVRVRLSHCQVEGGGRGGSHVECSGGLVGHGSPDIVKVRYDGMQGEVVPAARTPWGTFVVVDRSFTSWGTAMLFPLLPLGVAALAVYFVLRAGRRSMRQTASSAS